MPPAPPLVVVGSVNIDLMLRCPALPRPGETVTGDDFRCEPGGKGANQAVAAARLGARVTLVGCVGDDTFGAQSIAGLRAEGIVVAQLRCITGCATGVAMVQVDARGQNSIVLGPGANAALSVADVDAAAVLIADAGLLICQLETPLAAVQRAVEIAHAAGVPVWLNPAPAQPLPAALLRQVALLIPNEGEAALLTGLPVDSPAAACEAAKRLRDAGCAQVLVTLGAAGVVLADAEGCTHHPAPAAAAIDTTGAGDTFIGALAAACLQGRALHSGAIEYAQRAAAFSVQRRGAQAAMPRADDLADLADPAAPPAPAC
jgi:ribokinase